VAFDASHSGLPCRASDTCTYRAHVPALATLVDFVAICRERITHELAVHGYVHVAVADGSWSFSQRFSKQGRSTMAKQH
jgi:hypothetical protein